MNFEEYLYHNFKIILILLQQELDIVKCLCQKLKHTKSSRTNRGFAGSKKLNPKNVECTKLIAEYTLKIKNLPKNNI